MFQFPAFASYIYEEDKSTLSIYDTSKKRWVSPFGNLRIKVCKQLPEVYRSLPRPSSPPSAKASTLRP